MLVTSTGTVNVCSAPVGAKSTSVGAAFAVELIATGTTSRATPSTAVVAPASRRGERAQIGTARRESVIANLMRAVSADALSELALS